MGTHARFGAQSREKLARKEVAVWSEYLSWADIDVYHSRNANGMLKDAATVTSSSKCKRCKAAMVTVLLVRLVHIDMQIYGLTGSRSSNLVVGQGAWCWRKQWSAYCTTSSAE